jgi:glycosyltransferase involved in cell wall biosynthesis
MPRLSVVIPTYDRAALVARAIESVRAQTVSDLEILVVDDGSRDDTARVVGEIAARDRRVVYLAQENRGCAAARNHGIARATAPHVGLLDSDDVWLPEFAAAQLDLLASTPGATLAQCDARPLVPRAGRPASMLTDPEFVPPLSLEAMCDGAWSRPSAWCLERETLARIGFREECRICEDTDFLFRFFLAGGRAVLHREVLAAWGEDAGPGTGARLTSDDLRLTRAHTDLLAHYLPHAPHPRRARKRLFRRRRHLAVDLVRAGRRREARALLWGWWKARPLHLGVLKDLLLGFVRPDAPHEGQGIAASPSTSMRA